jgi:TolB-like protein
MALLPFTMASPDPELRNLAAQARDALAHALSQSGMPVRLLSSPPQNSNAAGDFLISGEVGRNADKIVATVRLDEVTHRMTIFSQHFEAARDEVRDFPERIGVQMAGTLTDGATLLLLDRRHPVDPAVLVELLADTGDLLKQYQISKRVAAKAPDVASAQIGVAFYTGFVLADLPRDERPQAVAEARAAADRGMALAPEFGDTYVTWCLLHSETRWAECEDRMRRGNRIDPDAPYLKGFLAYHLRNVGRVDEGVELSRLSYSHDPYNLFKIADMLRTLELSGDSGGARELYEKGTRWWPDHRAWFLRNRMFGLVQRGDFDAMARVEQEVGADALPTGYRASAPIAVAVKAKSAPALRRACVGGEAYLMMLRCMVAFATVGDLDDAYGIADKLYPARIGRTPAETERIWLDDPTGSAPLEFITSAAAAPVRRDPRYLVLAQRSGLLDYWRIGRMPDFCRNRPEPVCRQLLNSR